ncbi:MAG: TldD/PmbA family protein [Roseburia sp.]|nr:TldD/PmbA family protein [Roseburia sp.]
MINVEKLFKAAKAAGIAQFEARIETESKLSVSVFNTELENFTVADNGSMKIRGLVDGKRGVFASDRVDDEVIDTAIAALKESAKYGNPLDPDFFIGGDNKYEKVDVYNAELEKVSATQFINISKSIAEKTLAADKRIELATVSLEYQTGTLRLVNNNGLDVEAKANNVMVLAQVKAVDGGEIQSNMHYQIAKSLDEIDVDKFVAELVDTTVKQFGGSSVESGKYKVVYSPDCVAVLISTLKDGFSAFNVEQHISLLEGKIGTKAFSELLTLEETPIGNDPFCSAFDDEGVPCKNKVLIDKGVPTGYVYDLDTAKRAGVKSTGNGRLRAGNVRPSVSYVTVKPSDKSLAELFKLVGDGIYITDLGGVSTGINEQSGNYSLQASGYVIENGKQGRPVSLITVAGNIITDFADIAAVGSDSKLTYYGVKAPSLVINELSISGK